MKNIKHSFSWHGKEYFYLGEDKNGEKNYLEKHYFDCGWYWGIGYIETFTNNRNPERSRDISSHTHFDYMFFNGRKNGFDNFNDYFVKSPFTDAEKWKIIELMKSLYNCRNYSDMLYTGGSHYTSNPVKCIKNKSEYKRINKVVIPALNRELYKILKGV